MLLCAEPAENTLGSKTDQALDPGVAPGGRDCSISGRAGLILYQIGNL